MGFNLGEGTPRLMREDVEVHSLLETGILDMSLSLRSILPKFWT